MTQQIRVQLEPAELSKSGVGGQRQQTSESWEPVTAGTDRGYTVQQMARAWQALGRPISRDDAALSVDPDDYPLF